MALGGTRTLNGRRITHALVQLDDAHPLDTLEQTIAENNLDWLVVAMQGALPGPD
ncbi:MAG: hypothetical protein HQL63_13885, partial [Magnetococcales bacterium]|nr:hypothetical protein [Magnetococcales bacterium]